MCNYMTGFPLQSRSEIWCESLTFLCKPFFSTLPVRFEDEDDNRGSGR